MTWSVIQSASGSAFSTSVSATYGTNLSSGTKIVAVVASSFSNAPTGVHDGASNALTLLGSKATSTGSCWLYAMDTPAGDVGTKPTITAALSGSNGQSIVILEVSGLAAGNTTAMIDGTPGTLSGTTQNPGSPTYSSAASGEYLVCIFGNGNTGVSVTAPDGTWTLDPNNAGSQSRASIEYKSSTGGAETGGFNSTGTGGWADLMVAFKLAGGGSTTSSGGLALPPAAQAGAGTQVHAASGMLPLPRPAQAGTGTQQHTASGTAALPVMGMAGSATETPAGSASGSLALPAMAAAAAGESFSCSGSLALAPGGMAGTAAQVYSGSGSLALPAAAASGSAESFACSGSLALPAAGMAAACGQEIPASGTAALPAMGAAGSGLVLTAGSRGRLAEPPGHDPGRVRGIVRVRRVRRAAAHDPGRDRHGHRRGIRRRLPGAARDGRRRDRGILRVRRRARPARHDGGGNSRTADHRHRHRRPGRHGHGRAAARGIRHRHRHRRHPRRRGTRRHRPRHRDTGRPAVIDTGQVYEATLTIQGQASAPATATLVITLPDGTTVTPVTGTGAASGSDWIVTYDYQTVQAGLHKAAWLTTSPGTAATDYFSVRDFASILSLAEAKGHLSAGPVTTWTGNDDELRNFLQAVTEAVESKVGPCVRRSVTQRVNDACGGMVLNQAPVISVTSVTSVWTGGPSWAGAQLVLDGDAGIVSVQLGGVPFYWGPWDVVHVIGRAVVKERHIHGAKELLRHLWETQRGQLAAPVLGGGESFTASNGLAFSIPNRVLEMLADDMTPAI